MSLTYIAGYDGTEAASSAVALARTLAGATGADVIAAVVYEPIPVIYGRGSSGLVDAELEDEIRGLAERTLAGLEEQDGVLRRVIPGESPAHGLHRLAEQEEASLIAVGTTHRGAAGRVAVGSVGFRLLHGSPCPVLVVPADATGEIHRIAVAFDDGEEAHAALDTAAELAMRLGAELLLIAAAEPLSYAMAAGPEGGAEIEHVAERLLEIACDKAIAGLPDAIEADKRVRIGPAGRVIADAAKDDVDLIVTGSRGYGPLRSVLAGSTSRYLADHAPCPVLVVPRGARAELDRPVAAAAAWRV
jgi:nucleotide-binding universal stress UspA family protein